MGKKLGAVKIVAARATRNGSTLGIGRRIATSAGRGAAEKLGATAVGGVGVSMVPHSRGEGFRYPDRKNQR